MVNIPPKRPHYFADKELEDLLAEIEEIISSTREWARQMDAGYAMVKNSIRIRKQLTRVSHLCHSLRKEVIERRETWRKLRTRGGKDVTASGEGNNA
jgi:hypothetical protein